MVVKTIEEMILMIFFRIVQFHCSRVEPYIRGNSNEIYTAGKRNTNAPVLVW